MNSLSPLIYLILLAFLLIAAEVIGRALRLRKRVAGDANATYQPQLDGLRGIAAASVLLYHANVIGLYMRRGVWEPPDSNFCAQLAVGSVTMFFFLTGYLFWSRLLSSPIRFFPFIRSRAARLLPASLTANLIVSLVFLCLVPAIPVTFKSIAGLTSWLLLGTRFNVGSFPISRLNAGVYWTLHLEWVFYAVVPLLSWFTRRFRIIYLMGGIVLLRMASELASPYLNGISSVLVGFFHQFLNCFVWMFSVGMACAYVRRRFGDTKFARHPLWTPSILAILVFTGFYVPAAYGFLESIVLAPVFLLLVCGNTLSGLLTWSPLIYLGSISYSVYLLHGVVLFTFSQMFRSQLLASSPGDYWIFVSAVSGLVVLLSAVCYRFVEVPAMHWLRGIDTATSHVLGFAGRKVEPASTNLGRLVPSDAVGEDKC